jgi:hypothetical protein
MKKHFNFIFSTFLKVVQNKNFVRKSKNKKKLTYTIQIQSHIIIYFLFL